MTRESKPYYQFGRPEMQAFLPSSYEKVLEIGCGEGCFRHYLTKPIEYWGVEQQSEVAKRAAVHLDKVIVGSYALVSNQLPEHYFDLIICNDVIEHMENHVEFLHEVKQKLSSHGRLVISIPNVRYLPNLTELLFKKDWRYREAGILDSTHLRFFTEKSLRKTLEETGWKVNKMSGINRYGSHRLGHKLVISYLAQAIFGSDSVYMQFAADLSVAKVKG